MCMIDIAVMADIDRPDEGDGGHHQLVHSVLQCQNTASAYF